MVSAQCFKVFLQASKPPSSSFWVWETCKATGCLWGGGGGGHKGRLCGVCTNRKCPVGKKKRTSYVYPSCETLTPSRAPSHLLEMYVDYLSIFLEDNNSVFSTNDLYSGFYLINLIPGSGEMTAFQLFTVSSHVNSYSTYSN